MWQVITTDLFDGWFGSLDDTDRENVLAGLLLLREKGPLLSRPYADTLEGSKVTNMKELRVQIHKHDYMIAIAEAEYQKYLDKLREQ